jgi:hypothetical protein
MSDRNAKQIVERVLSRLPDTATMEDVQYQLYVISKVQRGLREIRDGKGIPQAQLRKRIAKWAAR